MRKENLSLWVTVLALLFCLSVAFAKEEDKEIVKNPDQILLEVQRELMDLDRQFESIRKDLFFPKDSEVLFYLRSSLKENFSVKTLDLIIDGKSVHRHLYTDTERVAFNFSDLQPLHRLDLAPGEHVVVARVALGDEKVENREHRFVLKKENLPRFVEIEIAYDRKAKGWAVAEKIW